MNPFIIKKKTKKQNYLQPLKKELQQQQKNVKIDRLQLVPFDYMNNVTNRSVARTQYKELSWQ